jgi:hypothetical protein
MRPVLETPVNDELIAQTTRLTEHIYALHESGRPYDPLLAELTALVGSVVTPFDVDSAFGSVSPRSFAHDLHVRSLAIPDDLDRSEMLDLLNRVLNPKRGELRVPYWLACLARSTGDKKISDLIYWPGEYFQDGDNNRELSAEEILETALANGHPHKGA